MSESYTPDGYRFGPKSGTADLYGYWEMCIRDRSDGFHNDYGGETIEELRIRENNPYLKAVTPVSYTHLRIAIFEEN